MSNCKFISYTASTNKCLKLYYSAMGLRPLTTDLGDGTIMHFWVPKKRNPARPDVVLIHGFGANALWQFAQALPGLAGRFNLYFPDLLFFGKSFTARPDRSEGFQARCVKRVLEAQSVERFAVLGYSYGGFVAYSMASQFPESVERVVICCSGVAMEVKDIEAGMFLVGTVDECAAKLMPQTAEKLRETFGYVFTAKFFKTLPSWWLQDFVEEFCVRHYEERKQLLAAIEKDRKFSNLPRISQPTLIMWGDKDQVFPMELAYRLKAHLGDNAELVVFKNLGHCFSIENPKKFKKLLKAFLLNQPLPTSKTNRDKPSNKCDLHGDGARQTNVTG